MQMQYTQCQMSVLVTGLCLSVFSLSLPVLALDAPENVSATDGTLSDMVEITWRPVTPPAETTGYVVYRNTSLDSGSASVIARVSTNSCQDTSAETGRLYAYWVRATNSETQSALSSYDSGWRGLAAPTGISATDGEFTDRVQVSWNEVATQGEAINYEVWRSVTNNSGEATRIADGVPTNSYNDTDADTGVVYYYWVKSRNTFISSGLGSNDSGYARSGNGMCDYSGDGRSDLAVYGEEDGSWHILCSVEDSEESLAQRRSALRFRSDTAGVLWSASRCSLRSATSSFTFGGPGFAAVPGDYDGDGISDPAAYDRATGNWYVMTVSNTVLAWARQWGGYGYLPVPGRYYDERVFDFGVYDTLDGNWYLLSGTDESSVAGPSGNRLASVPRSPSAQWGGDEFVPVPGDYDGDGTNDLAVYHRPTGNWYVRTLSGDVLIWALNWGGGYGFTPVSGDYNGDSLSDLAVYHEESGSWYVQTAIDESNNSNISNGISDLDFSFCSLQSEAFRLLQWGGPGYSPVCGDYNGDGSDDVAVYHRTSGRWYVCKLDGSTIIFGRQWGGPGYRPVAQPENGVPDSLGPVYRLYTAAGQSSSAHVYTIDAGEAALLQEQGWTYEGVAWYASASSSWGAVPLYRIRSLSSGAHYYTIDADEYTAKVASGLWAGEGFRYFVWPEGGYGRVPVYALCHSASGQWLYTINEQETADLASSGCSYDGIVFYAYPGQ